MDVSAAQFTRCIAINNRDEVTGLYGDATGLHGFILANGAVTAFDFPGAAQTIPQGINVHSDIVGAYVDGSGAFHGFLLSRGSATTVDFPDAIGTLAGGLNAKEDIVGNYQDSNGVTHGFLLKDGEFTTIDIPGAVLSFPTNINAPRRPGRGIRG